MIQSGRFCQVPRLQHVTTSHSRWALKADHQELTIMIQVFLRELFFPLEEHR